MTYASPAAKLCIAAGLLSGCAPMTIPSNYAATSMSSNPLLCASKAQCDIYWQRAQAWVANNSEYRLQTVTDTIIETQGPILSRSALAFRVTRVPDNADGARIVVVAACGSAFGCKPESSAAVTAFEHFVAN